LAGILHVVKNLHRPSQKELTKKASAHILMYEADDNRIDDMNTL
jgi:hypothetical protein